MSEKHRILQFIRAVQNRLNQGLIYRSLQWSAFSAALVLVTVGLGLIVCGHRIPGWLYAAVLTAAAALCATLWFTRRVGHDKACRFADRFFELRDGIISYIGFRSHGCQSGVYQLQADQVKQALQQTPPAQTIPLGLSRRVCIITALLVVTGLLMGFIDDSDRIKAQKQLQAETLSKTEQINEALKEELENVLQEIEKDPLDDPEVSKQKQQIEDLVKELQQTDDPKEALSQYAQLEKKLNKLLNSNRQRKDELLLERVGQELKQNPEGKKLGQKLTRKDYKAAAEELQKHKQAFNKNDKEALKKFAKLKTISQQMAATASASQTKSSTGKPKQNSSGNPGENSAQACSSSNGSESSDQSSDGMSGQMSELDQAVRQCEKSGCKDGSQCNQKIDQLSQSLCKLGSKRDFQQKMKALSKKLGQCQSFMCNSQCNSLAQCLGAKPGGQKAGFGSVDSRTDTTTPEVDNGNYTSLQGLKNTGPSQVTTEESDSGSGASASTGVHRQVEYRQQAEAYIQRQDVPVEVKQGVKRYFENIHQED